jgi:hypothetical protein
LEFGDGLVQEKGLIHVKVPLGPLDFFINSAVISVKLLVDFEIKEFLPVIKGVDQKAFELWDMD